MADVRINKVGNSRIDEINNVESNNYRFTWNKIFREIKDSVTDPKARGQTFVFGQAPDWFVGESNDSSYSVDEEETKLRYPIIVVNNVTVSDFENQTLDYETSQLSSNVVIEIYSDRNDYLDKLSDEVLYTLYNNVQTNTSAGLHNMQIMNDAYNFFMRGGVKVHSRTYSIRFDRVRG